MIQDDEALSGAVGMDETDVRGEPRGPGGRGS